MKPGMYPCSSIVSRPERAFHRTCKSVKAFFQLAESDDESRCEAITLLGSAAHTLFPLGEQARADAKVNSITSQ